MTTTTYYDLNIVEGTDIVNPMTVDNPNYEKIDEVMHDNAVSGVTLATEIANATVHAITRENSECAVIRFIATSNWKTGDSVTVDGVPVTALLPSGETLPDGAYVINANVLCILTGTNLTVYAERKKIDNASDISYKDSTVESALDAFNDDLQRTPNALSANDDAAVTGVYGTAYSVAKLGLCFFTANVSIEGNIIEGVAYVKGFPIPQGAASGISPIFNCVYRNTGSGATKLGTCYISANGKLVCGFRDHREEIAGYNQILVNGMYFISV